jgi:uncharacterized membrane protein YeaQ/YmgE (transglycosylase-associated protein family)
MEFLFIVFYAVILGLVAPYVTIKSDKYGSLVPPTIALAGGSVLWILLTWFGFPYTEGWIWSIVMIAMPVIMFFGSKRLEQLRSKADHEALIAAKRLAQ